MSFYSPLRYPGGKRRLAKFFALVCQKNNINGHYVEPYAGGAAVALHLLFNNYVKKTTINDADKAIYAFWHAILNNTERFCKKIKNIDITVKNWEKFKKIHANQKKASLFDVGFATFFLNRTNRSGVVDGGIMGGKEQKGKYKIDCRFNKENLIRRIKFIALHKNNINLYNLDALKLIKRIRKDEINQNTIFYFDPPYYLKGPSLYIDYYKNNDHKKVSNEIKKIRNARWIISYDNVPEIKKLYYNLRKRKYTFIHTAYKAKKGKEVLVFSNNLIIPKGKVL